MRETLAIMLTATALVIKWVGVPEVGRLPFRHRVLTLRAKPLRVLSLRVSPADAECGDWPSIPMELAVGSKLYRADGGGSRARQPTAVGVRTQTQFTRPSHWTGAF